MFQFTGKASLCSYLNPGNVLRITLALAMTVTTTTVVVLLVIVFGHLLALVDNDQLPPLHSSRHPAWLCVPAHLGAPTDTSDDLKDGSDEIN